MRQSGFSRKRFVLAFTPLAETHSRASNPFQGRSSNQSRKQREMGKKKGGQDAPFVAPATSARAQRKDKKRRRLEKLCQASIEKSLLHGILGEF